MDSEHYQACKREFDAMVAIAVAGGSVGSMTVHADKLMQLLAVERQNEELKRAERRVHPESGAEPSQN